jgi:hypothetical protein
VAPVSSVSRGSVKPAVIEQAAPVACVSVAPTRRLRGML